MNYSHLFFAKLILALLVTCSTNVTAAPDQVRPLRVVASFSILADLTRNIGGDVVDVAALVGPDADAHVFEPSPADARRLAQADLVIVNGLHFEGWLARLITASGYRGPIVVATTNVNVRRGRGVPDPHAWQDLRNGRIYVENIRAALVNARPAHAASLNERAEAYGAKLVALDQATRARFTAVPASSRRVITLHDAFGYFGAAYGVEFLAPQGWSTDSEASAANVAQLIRQMREQRVRAVFLENISNPRLMLRLVREGGGVIGGTLYSDALSSPGTAADTYIRMFEHNTATIIKAIAPSAATAPRATAGAP